MSSNDTLDLSGSQTDVSGVIVDVSGSQTNINVELQVNPAALATEIPQQETTPPLFSINDLINDSELVQQKEKDDEVRIEEFINPPLDIIKPTLLQWAKAGFPDLYSIRNISLQPPTLCSDGIYRSLLLYYEYVYKKTLGDSLAPLQSKVQGMNFIFSHDGATTITLHVSKA